MPLTKVTPPNLHQTVKTMVTTMVNETAVDSADVTLIVNSNIAAKDTDDISEGSTNLYYTDARADARAQLKVDALVGSAPGTLDTLQELGDALGDDPNFATTITNSIATKLPLSGGTLTGNLTLTSTASGSSASPELELRRDITGADANYLGQIKFTADNDADQNVVFAKITGKILDASDGTEDGIIEFAHKKAGSNNISARFRSDSLQLINGTNLTVAGTTDLTGNLTVDTNTLYVDTSNNKVGIGTTSPLAMLDIKGNTTTYDGMAKIYLTDSNSNSNSRNWSIGNGGSAFGNLTFAVSAAKDGVAGDGTSINAMVIDNTGDVGIGTNSPQAKLHVSGNVLIEGGSTDSRTIGFTNASGSTGWSIGNGIIDSTHNFRIYDNTAGAARFTVDGNGNVGIGTASPGQKLTVAGGIESTSAQGSVAFYSTIAGSYNQQNGTGGTAWAYGSTGGNSAPNTAASTTFGLHHWNGSAWSNPLNVLTNGNVGIGATSADAKLAVISASDEPFSLRATDSGWNYAKFKKYDGTTDIGYWGAANTLAPGGGAQEFAFRSQADLVLISHGNNASHLRLNSSGDLIPTTSTQDLGSTTDSWQNIYTQDMHLSNESRDTGNEIDGTKGNWTIQEGAEDLYIINNKSGKRFRFKLEEIE